MTAFLRCFFVTYIFILSLVTIALAVCSVHAESANNDLATSQAEPAPAVPSPIKFEYGYSPQWYELSTDLSEYPPISLTSAR